MKYDLKQFTPAEAAKVSGVSVASQRDWRRRGFLPKTEGHARFSIFEVAEMLVLSSLGDQGIGPSQVRSVLPSLGAGVVGSAVMAQPSVTGDLDAIYIDSGRLPWLLEELERTPEDPSDECHPLWQARAYQLRCSVLAQAGHDSGKVGNCAILWADGSIAFYGSPINAYEAIEDTDRRRAGAVVIVDFGGIGRLLVSRTGPIVTVSNTNPGLSGPKHQRAAIAAAMARSRPEPNDAVEPDSARSVAP